jgi:LAO/AO transport system kinase
MAESDPDGLEVPRELVPVIGITGPPGVGKSTLVNGMITALRSAPSTVAVLAVDPSSPITGGALLGDRIRMQDHAGDSGVYVRSMATRGHLGGLARAARQAVNLMSISGFDYIVVETVGVGQSEVEVMDLVDIVILVLAPGWGDQIQADKAGIVEIADVFVINKSDRPGVEPLRRALSEIAHSAGVDREILVTNALTGEGVDKLLEAARG